MKQLLVVAIMLSTATSFAARSRMNALGNPRHIQNDSATLQLNPAYIFNTADSVTLESGSTQTSTASGAVTTGAEATLIRTMGDAKAALVLGHDDANVASLRNEAGSASAPFLQQNPLELTYGMKMGDMNLGATLVYSKYNDKKGDVKEDTTLLKLGTQTSSWDVSASFSLVDKVTSGTVEYKGGTNINLLGGYWLDSDLYAYGTIGMNSFEVEGSKEYKSSEYEVGIIHTVKNDGSEFFYGVGLNSTTSEDDKATGTAVKETTEMSLPVIVGIEANAASWLTLRGSVTQTVLISDSKEEQANGTNATETAPGENTTTFAAGAGLKFNKVTLDGSLLVDGSQELDADNMLGNVALTYAF